MPSYDFTCPNCDSITTAVVAYAVRDEPNTFTCIVCDHIGLVREFPAPRVMKESYPDGHKRKGFAELREYRKMQKTLLEARNSPSKFLDESQYREMKEDIKKVNRAYKDKTESSGGSDDGVVNKSAPTPKEE